MTTYRKFKVERAVPLKRRNNLQSSEYSNVKPLIPSYDNPCVKPNLNYLLSMEYQRMWIEERLYYIKGIYREKVTILRRKHAIKHQDKFPHLKVPDRIQPRTTKYDHVNSKYKTIINHPRYSCTGHSPTDKEHVCYIKH